MEAQEGEFHGGGPYGRGEGLDGNGLETTSKARKKSIRGGGEPFVMPCYD